MYARLPQGLLAAICIAFNAASLPGIAFSEVYANGYYRKDGTYVQPHYRSDPDGNFYNNWSTKGNYNPYTGAYGTRVTPGGSTIYYEDTSAKEELAAQRAHEEKLLRMQLEHESSMLDASVKQKRFDEKNSIELIRRERARNAVQNSRVDARLTANPYMSARQGHSATHTTEDFRKHLNTVGQMREQQPVQIKSHNVLHFNGIDIYMEQQALLRQHPGIESNGHLGGAMGYDVSGVVYSFANNLLRSAELTLDTQKVAEAGGYESLMALAKSSFGKPTEETHHTALWLFPASDQLIMASVDGENWCLFVTRSSLLTQEQIDSLIP
jgi:hypothetical protein